MTTDHMLEDIHNTNVSLSTSLMASTTEEGDVAIKEEVHLQPTPPIRDHSVRSVANLVTLPSNVITDLIMPTKAPLLIWQLI